MVVVGRTHVALAGEEERVGGIPAVAGFGDNLSAVDEIPGEQWNLLRLDVTDSVDFAALYLVYGDSLIGAPSRRRCNTFRSYGQLLRRTNLKRLNNRYREKRKNQK